MSYIGDTSTFLVPAYCSELPHLRRQSDVYCTSIHGTIYYSPRNHPDAESVAASPATFPIPHIQARQRRPHSIHIVSYPAGYIPSELRPLLRPKPEKPRTVDEEEAPKKNKKKKKKKDKKAKGKKEKKPTEPPAAAAAAAADKKVATACDKTAGKVLERFLAVFGAHWHPKPQQSTETPQRRSSQIRSKPRPVSLFSLGSRLSRVLETIYEEPMTQTPTMVEAMRPPLISAGIQLNSHHRNSMMSTRSVKSIMSSSVSEIPNKPVASGSGVTCSILLAEPNVFLTGFDHDGHNRHDSTHSTALLRGKLQLSISKNVKIKSVMLKLTGKARTDWPEGIPPMKVELFEETSLRTQALTFFHAMHESWETPFGNQCTYKLKGSAGDASASISPASSAISLHRQTQPTAKELKRLSLQSAKSRSFGKGESPIANPVHAKGFKVFYPGTYEYAFELPIDHHQLETLKLQYASVKWELQTTVERAGAFKPNLHGTKEVSIVRLPDQMSLEMSEPISISRQWEDQLHYDIIISGKSFPIGSKIPIAFKLTPLAKVQVHKLKVFVTESAEYWTNDRRVTRKDPGRKLLLLEKTAGKPLDKVYERCDLRVLTGGELTAADRSEARAAAARRRTMEAERSHTSPEPLPEPTENILGDLDLGLESYWGSTEIEMNVQLPTCEQMARDKTMKLNPDCSWKNVNVFHWIKIVMRISRLDPDDPAGKRRRHFEISIDSPFTVLDCRATQANTALPQYSAPNSLSGYRQKTSCGCPDAEVLETDPSPSSSTGTLPMVEVDAISAQALPTLPQAAHLQPGTPGTPTGSNNGGGGASRPGSGMTTTTAMTMTSANPLQRVRDQELFQSPRPIHLIRVPSYDPPAFDADNPPPPAVPPPPPPVESIMTPPPNYDAIVGTPSVDGLADYFARLADYEEEDPDAPLAEDESDSGEDHTPTRITSRTGRVNIANPRTPGGRIVPSRSLDIDRPVMTLSMAGVVRRGEQ